MGVSGLWDILYELGRSRSLTNLTMQEGFEGNSSGRRAYRIGVDASLWYAHAAFAKGGENPDLRLLFFRCLQLAKLAVVPYFVFDGRKRPPVKRGSKKGKSGSHALSPGFKKIIECLGWTWREAEGEAEAELAYLNREGIIDAVLTDDGDALIFGATVVIRNQSNNLTGNKSKPALDLTGKASKDHVMVFTADALRQGGLDQAGLVLIAMLCGGDYVAEGIKGFGKATATALARTGFGPQLLNLYALRNDPDYAALAAQWRSEVIQELRTNSRGFLKHKHASLTLPENFPDLKILGYYVNPAINRRRSQVRDSDILCLPQLAAFCEKHFGEWGYEEIIIKRFRTLVWESTLCQLLRRASLEVDEQERERRLRRGDYNRDIRAVLRPSPVDAHGLSESFVTRCIGRREETNISNAFVNRPARTTTVQPDEGKNVLQMKIVGSTRKHASTDGLLEYRVEFTPSLFVEQTRLGISGTRGDPPPPPPSSQAEPDPWDVDFGPHSSQSKVAKGSSKPPPPPESPMRVWVCASLLEQVFPDLLEDALAARASKKGPKPGQSNRRAGNGHYDGGSSDVETLGANSSPPPQHSTPRVLSPLRQTASQPVAGTSRVPAHQVLAPMRSPLRPTQPRACARSTASLTSTSKPGFLFTFPYTDDPVMMLLEDGLDLPPTSSLPNRGSRPQASSAPSGPAAQPSSQPIRRTVSLASRPSTASGSGHHRPTTRHDSDGFDVASIFGGGDSDGADENELEPDIIRNASSATNNRMDHIFDSVFRPRGKGKGKAKRAAAPSASQPRPVKKRKTAQPPREAINDRRPLPPLQPRHEILPVPTPTVSRNAGLVRHSSDGGYSQASRASSEVIEINSDSDDDMDSIFPARLSSPPSSRFPSDDDSIIDLS